MQQIVNKLLNSRTERAEIYKHNGSMWLIFTDQKKWVVELTSSGTLWYNYYFFKMYFELLSLDVVENQHYITKWVEDAVINRVNPALTLSKDNTDYVEDVIQNGVKDTNADEFPFLALVEGTIQNGVKESRALEEWVNNKEIVDKTIQNGVKETFDQWNENRPSIKDVIQNGVKEIKEISDSSLSSEIFKVKCKSVIRDGVKQTEVRRRHLVQQVEDTIQNGIKETEFSLLESMVTVEDTIQNGIKETKHNPFEDGLAMEEAIQNGVKETHRQKFNLDGLVDDIIDNGVKETICGVLQILNPMDFEPEFAEMKRMNEVNIVLEGGIKETKTPGDGDLLETIKWLNEHNAHSVPDMIGDIVDNGIKATTTNLFLSEDDNQYEEIVDVIRNGIKTTQSGILFDESKVDTVINEGVKEIRTKELSESQVNRIIKNGIKEVQPLPAQDGNRDWGLYYKDREDRTKPHTEYVKDVIKDSIPMFKLVYNPNDFSPNRIEEDLREKVDEVLVDGIKETNWRRVDNFPEFEERVINGGTKI